MRQKVPLVHNLLSRNFKFSPLQKTLCDPAPADVFYKAVFVVVYIAFLSFVYFR